MFRLRHSTEDFNVPFEQILAVRRLLCRKGSPEVIVYLEEGKPHTSDYEESLLPKKRGFLMKREPTMSSSLKIIYLVL